MGVKIHLTVSQKRNTWHNVHLSPLAIHHMFFPQCVCSTKLLGQDHHARRISAALSCRLLENKNSTLTSEFVLQTQYFLFILPCFTTWIHVNTHANAHAHIHNLLVWIAAYCPFNHSCSQGTRSTLSIPPRQPKTPST